MRIDIQARHFSLTDRPAQLRGTAAAFRPELL